MSEKRIESAAGSDANSGSCFVDPIIRGYSEAIAEYFEWLTQAEIEEAERPTENKARSEDCFASASSMLGLLLIKHGIYSANDQVEARRE